jgi:TPR repeat protein
MTLVRLKGVICLAIPLMLAFASGDAAVASPAQSGQTVHVDGLDKPVELPVVFPPVKKFAPTPKPTEQELRTRAETGNVDAMEAYADFLPTPSDFPWFLKAAEGGSPTAMLIVADRAKRGQTGYGIDLALSDKWLNKPLQMGRQALTRKDAKMLRLILKAYAQYGDLDAATKTQYALVVGRAGGFEIEDGFHQVILAFPDTPEKIQLLQKCSNDGHPWCTSRLANDYLNGDDGLIIDRVVGVKLLTKVAQAGYDFDSDKLLQAQKIELWNAAIEHGAIDCALDLADAYRDGNGVPKSAPIAAALLETLIHRPDLDGEIKGAAIWTLARMYLDGRSFPVNEQLFLRELNLTGSYVGVGRHAVLCLMICDGGLLSGNDTLNVTEQTRLLLLKSAVESSPPFNDVNDPNTWYYRYNSALILGDLYSSGQKVKQSYADAMTWYQKAEQIAVDPSAGDYWGDAAIKIGKLYEEGLGVPKNLSTAMSWYQKAGDGIMSHSPDQPWRLVQLLNSVQLPKDYVDRVISFIRSSAEAGHSAAQLNLGTMYYEGKYLPQSYQEAAGWFEKCGSQLSKFDSSAMKCTDTLGEMYLQGQGVTRDPAKAVYYYQRLIDTGSTDPRVEGILLPMYCGGEGIPRDRPKAFAVYKKDADRNDSFGELGVGAMYQMGWGAEQDLAEAFNWYRKAAADKNYSSAKAKADFTRIFRDCKGTPENFNAAVTLYDKASAGQH